jgi:hypothetical protein
MILTQFSRIQHHTLTNGLTFSVPATEDFTSGSWSSTDLVRSEIGVDELNKEVFIRIDDEIIKIGGSTSSLTLQQVVDNGNTLSGTISNTGIIQFQSIGLSSSNDLVQGDLSILSGGLYPNIGTINAQQQIDPNNPSYSLLFGWLMSESILLGAPTSSFIPEVGLFHFRTSPENFDPTSEVVDYVDEFIKGISISDSGITMADLYNPLSGNDQSLTISTTRVLATASTPAVSRLIVSGESVGDSLSYISTSQISVSDSASMYNIEVTEYDGSGTIRTNQINLSLDSINVVSDNFNMNGRTGFTGTFSSNGVWDFENGILVSFTP